MKQELGVPKEPMGTERRNNWGGDIVRATADKSVWIVSGPIILVGGRIDHKSGRTSRYGTIRFGDGKIENWMGTGERGRIAKIALEDMADHLRDWAAERSGRLGHRR